MHFRLSSDLAKFSQDWGTDLCESRRRAHSPIGVSFRMSTSPSPVPIGKPAPKTHQWTIYFCRWGLGWVSKAHCFRLASRFGAAVWSPGFSSVFHAMARLGLCLETFFQCSILSYPGQPLFWLLCLFCVYKTRPFCSVRWMYSTQRRH